MEAPGASASLCAASLSSSSAMLAASVTISSSTAAGRLNMELLGLSSILAGRLMGLLGLTGCFSWPSLSILSDGLAPSSTFMPIAWNV